jgi:hypothetical protein
MKEPRREQEGEDVTTAVTEGWLEARLAAKMEEGAVEANRPTAPRII